LLEEILARSRSELRFSMLMKWRRLSLLNLYLSKGTLFSRSHEPSNALPMRLLQKWVMYS